MKKIKAFVSLVLALTLCLSLGLATYAQVEVTEIMTKESFTAQDGTILPYRLYVPADYTADKAYSFLLFLHGAGNRGDENESQVSVNTGMLSRIINGETVTYNEETIDLSKEFIIVAPQCAKEMQWVDTPWGQKPDPSYVLDEIPQSAYMTAVVELIETMKKDYNLDESRLYVTGLSMGGFGTWDLIMRYPDTFAAAIPMGGAADLSKAETIAKTPVWTFHQLLDPTVSSEGTQNIVTELVKIGADVQFNGYFDPKHNAWDKGYAEEDLLQWMYSYTKTEDTEVQLKDSILESASDWAKKELALSYVFGLTPDSVTDAYQESITRADFCKAVVNMIPESVSAVREDMNFADTEDAAINRAYTLGIVNGQSETAFAPDAKITREAICAMLARAYKLLVPDVTVAETAVLPDADAISDWAKEDVALMNGLGIMEGDDAGNINPQDETTREQAIALVYRAYFSANSYGKVK